VFGYDIELRLVDQFGNSYPEVWDSKFSGIEYGGFTVVVEVSTDKVGADNSAALDFALAVGFTQQAAIAAVITAATACTGVGAVVGAGVAAGFSAAAFAMQQAAQGQAALANDPPPPDFLTREPMTIVAAAYSSFGEFARHVHSGEFTRRLGDFMRFVEAAVFVQNAAKALPKIQAKLVGAVSAHDETGEKFQINQCREFVDALDKGIANLESAVPAAVAEFKRLTEPHLTAIKHAHHNLLRSGLSQDERNELLSCGLPPNLIRIFERLRSQNKLQPPTIKINGHEVFNCRIIELGGAALISYGKAIRLSAVSIIDGSTAQSGQETSERSQKTSRAILVPGRPVCRG
jgi:hypothetical protein